MSQQINLFNPVFRKQRNNFSLLNMLQAFGLIVAVALLFYGYAFYQTRQLELQFAESTKRFDAEQARMMSAIAEFSQQRTGDQLQSEVSRLEKQVADQADLINSLKSGAAGNASGYSEYMRAFARQAMQGLWLTGFTVVGEPPQISLSGGVQDAALLPVYIQRLGKEKIMQGKTFSNLQMQQPKVATDKDGKPAAAPRYTEFKLFSAQDGEVKK
ncbi:MAG TPA: fimbrial assembly protein [Gallionella sp.]|nr:fimbrial assembly protein [Gallionella sp.]